MSRLPIRLRLTIAFALAVALVLAVTSAVLYLRLASDLESSLDQGLRSRAQDLSAAVRGPRVDLGPAGRAGLVERGESFAELLGADGRVIDASRSLRGKALLTAVELARARRETILVERSSVPGLDEPSRLLATPLRHAGGPLVLVVGATLGNRAEALASLRGQLLVGGPLALAFLVLGAYLMAGAALRPIESMRRRAAAISAATPGERLPVPPAHDEVRQLGETLNEMLGRLERALARERRLVADAGHELRTPLALLKMELELVLRHGGSPDELERSILSAADETDRLAQLAENLLLLAHVEEAVPGAPPVTDVETVCTTVLARFLRAAELAGRPLREELAGGVGVRADALQLEQALGNLVDNALRYGEGAIVLLAREEDGRVELHVRDHGPGFPSSFLPRAFERFSRADDSRGRGGAGLGLAIVKAVAEASGGTARAANRPEGGADVWLSLPRVDGAASGPRATRSGLNRSEA